LVKIQLFVDLDTAIMTSNYIEQLCEACKIGDLEQVQYWIDQNVDLDVIWDKNDKSKRNMTPLRIAIEEKNMDVIKLLLKAGANVNKADKYGNAPLYKAASTGQLEVVKLLIDNGADVNKANDNGNTPLYIAAEKGQLEVMKLANRERCRYQ